MNFQSVHLVFPLKTKKKSNVANNILVTEITINNFFAHWIKEIDIKCLRDDIPILLTTNTIDIYKYSDVKTFAKKAKCSKKKLSCLTMKIDEKGKQTTLMPTIISKSIKKRISLNL